MTQKDAVIKFVIQVLSERGVKYELGISEPAIDIITIDDKMNIRLLLQEGIVNGNIEYGKRDSTKEEIKRYVYGILNNYLRKILDLNQGKRYEKTQITTINQDNFNSYKNSDIDSVVMYVGTSGSFASRVKTHSGHGSKGTATVFFKHWPITTNSGLVFKFKYYNFEPNIGPETLKFFEKLCFSPKTIS